MLKITEYHRTERVFIISIRKDIDKGYEFPEPFPLQLRLKDMLDAEVDEKFYLSEKCINGFVRHRERHEAKGTGFKWEVRNPDGVASCLRANSALAPTDNTVAIDRGKPIQVGQMYGTDKEHKCVPVEPVRLGNIYGEKFGTGYAGNVWDKECISPALMTMQGGNRQPLVIDEGVKAGNTSPSGNYNPSVLVREATKKGYSEAVEGDSVNIGQPNSKTRRGRVGKQVAQTLTTSGGNEMAVVVDD